MKKKLNLQLKLFKQSDQVLCIVYSDNLLTFLLKENFWNLRKTLNFAAKSEEWSPL